MNPNSLPVRPKPAMTSSQIMTMPYSSQRARTPSKYPGSTNGWALAESSPTRRHQCVEFPAAVLKQCFSRLVAAIQVRSSCCESKIHHTFIIV